MISNFTNLTAVSSPMIHVSIHNRVNVVHAVESVYKRGSRRNCNINNIPSRPFSVFSLLAQSIWCYSAANSRHDWRRRWAIWEVPTEAEDHQRQLNGWRSTNGWQKVSQAVISEVTWLLIPLLHSARRRRTVTASSAGKTNKDLLRMSWWVHQLLSEAVKQV